MKNLQTIKKQLSFFLSILILYSTTISCSQNYEEENITKNYSGEDIFKALFFLEGDLVEKIPSLNKIKVEKEIMSENPIFIATMSKGTQNINLQAEMDEQRESLMKHIREIDPLIFQELKLAIDTKNPDLVKEQLKKSALVVKTALFQNKEFKNGIKLIEDAKKNGGIDPENYNFQEQSELERYNNDMINFIKTNKEYSQLAKQEVLALAIVFLVTVVVLVAVLLHLVALVGGEVAIVIANFLWIYNIAWISNC